MIIYLHWGLHAPPPICGDIHHHIRIGRSFVTLTCGSFNRPCRGRCEVGFPDTYHIRFIGLLLLLLLPLGQRRPPQPYVPSPWRPRASVAARASVLGAPPRPPHSHAAAASPRAERAARAAQATGAVAACPAGLSQGRAGCGYGRADALAVDPYDEPPRASGA